MYNNNKDLPITYENQRLMQIFRDYASDIIFSIENIMTVNSLTII